MSKRPANEALFEEQPFMKAQINSSKRDAEVDEIGEFEDAWEDELESDEEVVDANDDNGRSVCMLKPKMS